MSGPATDKRLATAVGVRVDQAGAHVQLSDGRSLHVRFADHGFLRDATRQQRDRCIVDEKGTVLWWPDLREGISVAGLLGVPESELEEFAGLYR